METIQELFKVDYSSVFISVFVILIGIKAITSIFEWFIDKFGLETKWVKSKREEHNLLIQTSKKLSELQQNHSSSVKQLILDNKETKDELSNFIYNMNNSVEELKNKQDEIVCTVNKIAESNEANNDATIEEMCDRISQKIRYYINTLDGIPEDEYDDFVRLFSSYERIGGNHGLKKKYEYCINNLKVLPIKKEISFEDSYEK